MLNQMKKTLGILLVVCFLMSVAAAAVSAAPDHLHRQGNHHGYHQGTITMVDMAMDMTV
jgi:hypothetical protein